MPRKPRNDVPGGLYHVSNRGVAQRTIFESDDDITWPQTGGLKPICRLY